MFDRAKDETDEFSKYTTSVGDAPIGLAVALGGEALGNWIGNTFCPR